MNLFGSCRIDPVKSLEMEAMTKATEILSALNDVAEGRSEVTLGHVNDQIGHRGTGALLAIPAALEITPIGGIPLVPSTLAFIVAIFAVQIAFGREDMWLPGFLERRNISAVKLTNAVDKLRPAAEWSDRHLGKHLHLLTDEPAPRIVAVAILVLCALVPPLELVPFASSIPMGVIVLFGLALVTRDGRVMALAWAASAIALWAVWKLWP